MIDEYIDNFDGVTKERLSEIYQLIKNILPEANEKISYGVPTFYNSNGPIVYFAGYKEFISIYPVHRATGLEKDVEPFLHGKSTARFIHTQPLPVNLIKKIVLVLAEQKR